MVHHEHCVWYAWQEQPNANFHAMRAFLNFIKHIDYSGSLIGACSK